MTTTFTVEVRERPEYLHGELCGPCCYWNYRTKRIEALAPGVTGWSYYPRFKTKLEMLEFGRYELISDFQSDLAEIDALISEEQSKQEGEEK